MNKFIRTASTRRLLGVIAGVVLVIAAGTTIAIAARGSGPVPRPARLAAAIHAAMTARAVPGISADITFTNHLINASEIQGPTDPLLSGGDGHIWVSSDGRFRMELYGDNGDPAVVVSKTSWWVSDPTTQTVYEGTLPKESGNAAQKKRSATAPALPTIGQIQTDLNHLAAHLNISRAIPSDVAGQPTYTVKVSPKHDGGLLGDAELAWDAVHGVPLNFALYARGDGTPVLGLEATGISYTTISPSIFSLSPPAGYKTVTVSTPPAAGAAHAATAGRKGARSHTAITGVKAVATHLPFKLVAPSELVGDPRQSVSLLNWAGHPAALITYGESLGGIAVIEQAATAGATKSPSSANNSNGDTTGLSLPSVSIDGATGQELDTELGTLVRFTRGGVTYTVVGSVTPFAADAAARAL